MTLAGEQGETDDESDPAEVILRGFSAAWARLDGQVISLTADLTD